MDVDNIELLKDELIGGFIQLKQMESDCFDFVMKCKDLTDPISSKTLSDLCDKKTQQHKNVVYLIDTLRELREESTSNKKRKIAS